MSRIREIERHLEAALEAIEALDADLTAGTLTADDHRRRRAEREREGGRLLVSLRRARREAGARHAGWLQSPPVVAGIGLLLLVVGVGAGLAGVRWAGGRQGASAPITARTAAPGSGPSALLRDLGLGTLPRTAAGEDTPVPSLLQQAHLALDESRLDEARGLYDRALAREPQNAEAITHLGAILYREGRVDDALAKVEEALRIDPAYIHAHWDRTQYLFYGKRDYPGAVKAAEAFLQVLPDGPDADSVRRLMGQAREQRVKPGRRPGAGG